MARVNITVPDDVLVKIDNAAAKAYMNRSQWVRFCASEMSNALTSEAILGAADRLAEETGKKYNRVAAKDHLSTPRSKKRKNSKGEKSSV
jgi:hypothetical protein